MRSLWLSEARASRLQTLREQGKEDHFEARALERALQGEGSRSPTFKQILEHWLAALNQKRKAAWKQWLAQQRSKSGGGLFKWARRIQPEKGLTDLEPHPQGQTQTIHHRVKEAAEAWHSF